MKIKIIKTIAILLPITILTLGVLKENDKMMFLGLILAPAILILEIINYIWNE